MKLATFIVLLSLLSRVLGFSQSATTVVQGEYFVDTYVDFGKGQPIALTPAENIDASTSIDLSSLTPGQHRVYFRFKNSKGIWSHTYSQIVTKPGTTTTSGAGFEYFYDEYVDFGKGTFVALGENVNDYTLSAQGLEPGLHLLYVRSKSENNQWSLTTKRLFYVPDRSESANIVRLEYYFTNPEGNNATERYVFDGFDPAPSVALSEDDFLGNASTLVQGETYVLHVQAFTDTEESTPERTFTFAVPDPDGLKIEELAITNVGCDGNSDTGQVKIRASGGSGGYTYSLSTDSSNYVADSVFMNLPASSYTAYVQDSQGNIVSKEFAISRATPLSVTLDAENANCAPEPNGLIDVRASGAVPGSVYEYSLNGGEFQTESLFEGLEPGDYTVTVRSAGSCETTATATVFLQDDEVFIPQVFVSDGTTFSTYTLEANVPDDTESMQWYLDGEPIEGATERTLTVDKAGSYHIEIRIGWCTFASEPSEESIVTDTDEAIRQELRVYPNPAQATLMAEVPAGLVSGEVVVQLISSQGQLLQQRWLQPQGGVRSSSFDTSTLPAGLYILTLRGTDFFVRHKITKQ